MPGEKEKTEAAKKDKTGKVGRAPPLGCFAEASGENTEDANTLPIFARRKYFVWFIISPASGDDRNLVPALNQLRRKVAQMLCGGYDVRIKGLIKEKNFQNTANGTWPQACERIF